MASGYHDRSDNSHAALMDDGTLMIWSNFNDQGFIPSVLAAPFGVVMRQLAVGDQWVMVLGDNGLVYTMGKN